MKAIIYLSERILINSIKELKKKPLKMILYIAMGLLLIVTIRLSINNNTQFTSTNIEIYRSIFLGLSLVLLFTALKTGMTKGNTLFRLADTNFLFTAPIKPQLVLFYGFVKQMGSNLLLIILLSFQMPNLYNSFPMKSYGWALILLAAFLFALLSSIMEVLVYSLGTIKEGYKRFISYILYGLAGLVLLGLLYNIIEAGQLLEGSIEFLNMEFFNYIPILGWFLNIYTAAILGFNFNTAIYIFLLVITGTGFLFIIYNLNLDYYEDALRNSITKEEQLAKSKSGKVSWDQSALKLRKSKGKVNHTGSKTILSKQILEARKSGTIFVDKSTLTISGFSLVFAYIVRENGIGFLLYMLVYMNILFSQSNIWAMELEKHYIYLIPEPSIKKILYATLLENIKALITGLITFTIASFIYEISLVEGMLLGITYASFTWVVLFSDLVIRRILGGELSLVVERMMRLLIIGIAIAPGLITSFALGAGQNSYIILIVYNLLVSLLFIFLSKGIFEKIDMR